MDNSVSIRFFGDFTTGENYQLKYDIEKRVNVLRQKGYDFLMEKCKELLLDGTDFNIINLETPITTCVKSTLENKKAVVHWSDPLIVPSFLKKYNIGAVSLGNNHAYDYGDDGLAETEKSLKNAGIPFFGAGSDKTKAGLPFMKTFELNGKTVNLYVFGGYKYREDYDLEFDFYAKENKGGVFLLTKDTVSSEIKGIKEEDKNSFIVMFPHFGFDLQDTVSPQIETARSFIDSGADVVVGTGPHIMHKVEYYREKMIAYSLGNFLFPADFKNRGIPYNLVYELQLTIEDNTLKAKNKFYPIFIDNNSCCPQTRPVTEIELTDVLSIMAGGDSSMKEKFHVQKGRLTCIEV